jgi:hypothetical protein
VKELEVLKELLDFIGIKEAIEMLKKEGGKPKWGSGGSSGGGGGSGSEEPKQLEVSEVEEQVNNFYNKLDSEELETLKEYIDSENSFVINDMLNSGVYNEIKNNTYGIVDDLEARNFKNIDNLSSIIDKADAIPRDIKVFRYSDEKFIYAVSKSFGDKDFSNNVLKAIKDKDHVEMAKLMNSKGASSFTNKSFVSTSFNKKKNEFTDRKVLIELSVKKGQKALITNNFKESEILFDKGTKMNISGYKMDGEKMIVKVEVTQ